MPGRENCSQRRAQTGFYLCRCYCSGHEGGHTVWMILKCLICFYYVCVVRDDARDPNTESASHIPRSRCHNGNEPFPFPSCQKQHYQTALLRYARETHRSKWISLMASYSFWFYSIHCVEERRRCLEDASRAIKIHSLLGGSTGSATKYNAPQQQQPSTLRL